MKKKTRTYSKKMKPRVFTIEAMTNRVSSKQLSKMITKNNAESVIGTMNQSLNASVSSSGKRNLHILNVTWIVLNAVDDNVVGSVELMRNQFRLLRGTTCHKHSFQNALKTFAKYFKTESSKISTYLKVVKDLSATEKALACNAMSFELKKDSSYRQELLELFQECAIDSHTSLEDQNPFEHLLRTIDHKDFVKRVEPVIRVAFSKSYYGLIENIVSSVTIDLSRYLEKLFISELGKCLESEEKDNVEASIGIARALYPRCSDIDSLCLSLNTLTEKVKSSFTTRYGTEKMSSRTKLSSSSSKKEAKSSEKKTTKQTKKKKKKMKGFGSLKDKKKKKKTKSSTKKPKQVEKTVTETTATTTTTETSTKDKESHIKARVYLEYLLAARM